MRRWRGLLVVALALAGCRPTQEDVAEVQAAAGPAAEATEATEATAVAAPAPSSPSPAPAAAGPAPIFGGRTAAEWEARLAQLRSSNAPDAPAVLTLTRARASRLGLTVLETSEGLRVSGPTARGAPR